MLSNILVLSNCVVVFTRHLVVFQACVSPPPHIAIWEFGKYVEIIGSEEFGECVSNLGSVCSLGSQFQDCD